MEFTSIKATLLYNQGSLLMQTNINEIVFFQINHNVRKFNFVCLLFIFIIIIIIII
jgi:hypothetical protein